MPSHPLLVVITGPSGAGKDSLLNHIRTLRRPYHFTVTATTRPPREGETDGQDYYFVSPGEFQRMLEAEELLEHAEVYGHNYGVPRRPIREALAEGRDVLMRTDIQGARYIKSIEPGAVTIFIEPPSAEELERRLRGRETDTPEQIELRLEIARGEMAAAGEFDHIVVNDDLDRCAAEIEEVLERERTRPDRPRVDLS